MTGPRATTAASIRRKTVLVTGQGAREHALAVALARSPHVGLVIVSPGHAAIDTASGEPGTSAPIVTRPCGNGSPAAFLALARHEGVDLCVVGPEAHLAAGLVDAFESAGIAVFGPTRAAARIETSKADTRALLDRLAIPTPVGTTVTTMAEARDALETMPAKVVVKASGLAAGKGTFICNDHDSALGRIWRLLEGRELGDAGETIVIEHFEDGVEASVMAICDHRDCVVLPAVRDYKKAGDGDLGPNTGGLGAVAPVSGLGPDDLRALQVKVFEPVLHALVDEGRPFRGVLYAGLMMTARGPLVLEFNARFGDPETQVLLQLLASDLFTVLDAASRGGLREYIASTPITWRDGAAVGVVVAAAGYPGPCHVGLPLPDAWVRPPAPLEAFGAGLVHDENGGFANGGGRALTIVARANDMTSARERVYRHLDACQVDGFFYRRDIGAFADTMSGAMAAAGESRDDLADTVSETSSARPMTYVDAGVDIAHATDALMAARPHIEATWSAAVLSRSGAYAALFDTAAFSDIADPVLAITQDGLGTKTLLAQTLDDWESLGRDLVHHAINDLLATAARPLFLVDQIAAARLEPAVVTALLRGIAAACGAHQVALVGGETAEMPGVMAPDGVDVAATLCGVVARSVLDAKPPIRPGDVVFGLKSLGLHTNGFSLARRVFPSADLDRPLEHDGPPLRRLLLAPHRSYAAEIATLRQAGIEPSGLIHITGGAFRDNPPRVLPADCSLVLDPWPWPPLFAAIAAAGRVPTDEMRAVFNLGYGLLVALRPEACKAAIQLVPELIPLGRIVPRGGPDDGGRPLPPVCWSGAQT